MPRSSPSVMRERLELTTKTRRMRRVRATRIHINCSTRSTEPYLVSASVLCDLRDFVVRLIRDLGGGEVADSDLKSLRSTVRGRHDGERPVRGLGLQQTVDAQFVGRVPPRGARTVR